MYWRYNVPSVAIENLLQKEDVKLEELLAESELLQECKTQNNKQLIDYLTKPEIIEELVLMIVTEPLSMDEVTLRFKNANMAAELLTCDVQAITDKLASSTNLLQHLYKFFHNELPLNPLLASFVSKVLIMLLQRRRDQNWYSYQLNIFQVIDFIKSKSDFVDILVKNIGISAVMDLVLQLISGVEEEEDQVIKSNIHEWLNESHLIEKLVEKLSPECEAEDQASVDNILCIVCRVENRELVNGNDHSSSKEPNVLCQSLTSENTINKLLDHILSENRTNSSVDHVINILCTILCEYKYTYIGSLNSPVENFIDRRLIKTILARLEQLLDIIVNPKQVENLQTTYGLETEKLGIIRLRLIGLFSILIRTRLFEVHQEMERLNTLPLLKELFFKFSLNNFLHSEIELAFINILTFPMIPEHTESTSVQSLKELCSNATSPKQPENTLLHVLFTQCDIINTLMSELTEADEGAQEPNKKVKHNMKGYLGHLRQIANTLVESSQGDNKEIILKYIEDMTMDQKIEWGDFVTITLAELNLKNKILPIQDFRGSDLQPVDYNDSEAYKNIDNTGQYWDEEEGKTENIALFERMCEERCTGESFEEMVTGKEKEMQFDDTRDTEESEGKDDSHSSSEEDDDFEPCKRPADRMALDEDEDWSEVFDKRNMNSESFNPWELASAKDTDDNNTWANFEKNINISHMEVTQIDTESQFAKFDDVSDEYIQTENSSNK